MHADIVASNSQGEASQPAKVQAHVKAQSLQVAAQSLEAQAEMQTLQAQAQVHAEAQAEAQAQAEELNAQAAAHAEAHATATVNASNLAHSSMGMLLSKCCHGPSQMLTMTIHQADVLLNANLMFFRSQLGLENPASCLSASPEISLAGRRI